MPQTPRLEPYKPTLRNRLALALMGSQRPESGWGQFVQSLTGNTGIGSEVKGLPPVDLLPFLQAEEGGRSLATPGHRIGGAVNLGMAMMPMAPAGLKNKLAAKAAEAVTTGLERFTTTEAERAAAKEAEKLAKAAAKPQPAPKAPAPGQGPASPKTRLKEIEDNAADLGVSLSVQQGNGGLTVSKIVVPPDTRNLGIGSAVMGDLAKYADDTGQRMLLSPSTSFGGSRAGLDRFYKRHGFKPNTGRSRDLSVSEAMIREPTVTPPKKDSEHLAASMADIRPPKENVHDVIAANFSSGYLKGDEMAPIDSLKGGIVGGAGDQKRVGALTGQIGGPGGYVERLIADQDGNVIEGQHRLDALRALGAKDVPIVRVVDPFAKVDESKLRGVIEAAGAGNRDHQTQIMQQLGQIMADPDIKRPLDILGEYSAPAGFKAPWEAAIKHLDEVQTPAPKVAAYPMADREADGWYGNGDFEARGGKMVEMHPQDYLNSVRPLQIDDVSRENIDSLKAHMEEGGKLDPLTIMGDGTEDGRHRAHAALEMGMDKVPVLDFRAPKPPPIVAYHGSPHDFDQFSMEHIGAGEGNQAFGHGLYFAGSEDVARQYRDQLAPKANYVGTRVTIDGVPAKDALGADPLTSLTASSALEAAEGDIAAAAAALKARSTPLAQKAAETLEGITGKIEVAAPNAGHMYEVGIDADPHAFLDYDAHFKDQPEAVKKVLGYVDPTPHEPTDPTIRAIVRKALKQADGDPRQVSMVVDNDGDLYRRALAHAEANGVDHEHDAGSYIEEAAADYLRAMHHATLSGDELMKLYRGKEADLHAAGVPGVKYFDGLSRGGGDGEGTRNYVVFNDKLVNVLKKYGWVPGAGVPAAAMMEAAAPEKPPGT